MFSPKFSPKVASASRKALSAFSVGLAAAVAAVILIALPACGGHKLQTWRVAGNATDICFSTDGEKAAYTFNDAFGTGDVANVYETDEYTVYELDPESLKFENAGWPDTTQMIYFMPKGASTSKPEGSWGLVRIVGKAPNHKYHGYRFTFNEDGSGVYGWFYGDATEDEVRNAIEKSPVKGFSDLGEVSEHDVTWKKGDEDGTYSFEFSAGDPVRFELSKDFYDDVEFTIDDDVKLSEQKC